MIQAATSHGSVALPDTGTDLGSLAAAHTNPWVNLLGVLGEGVPAAIDWQEVINGALEESEELDLWTSTAWNVTFLEWDKAYPLPPQAAGAPPGVGAGGVPPGIGAGAGAALLPAMHLPPSMRQPPPASAAGGINQLLQQHLGDLQAELSGGEGDVNGSSRQAQQRRRRRQLRVRPLERQ